MMINLLEKFIRIRIAVEMQKRQWLILSVLSILCYFGIALLRGIYTEIGGILLSGSVLSSMIGFVVMFLLVCFWLKKFNGQRELLVLFCVWLSISIVEIPARFFVENTLSTLPTYLFWCAGILAAYCFWKAKGVLKISLVIICLAALAGTPYFYDVWTHYHNFGTFTGKVEKVVDTPIVFRNTLNEDIRLNDLQEKYIILDFWTTYCGICFKEFPEVQKMHNKYKQNPAVSLFSVHCKMDGETHVTGAERLQEEGYTFPCLNADIHNIILKKMGVIRYPTIIILDQERTIIFRGRTENAKQYLDKLNL